MRKNLGVPRHGVVGRTLVSWIPHIMKKQFAILLFALPAFAGTCPSGANYILNPATTFTPGTLASQGVTACYYASKSIGSDSYDGSQETVSGSHGPWAHIPGMAGCTSNCAAVTPAAGEGFILRGGDTWGTADLNYVYHGAWPTGTSSHPVYIGVDPAWYSGASWARPIWSCAGGSCSSGSQYANLGNSSISYIILDNVEMTGLHTATMSHYVDVGGTYTIVENIYAHGWEHTGASSDTGVAFSSANNYNTLRFCVCDGSDTTEDMLACVTGEWEDVYGNYITQVANGIAATESRVHDNWVGPTNTSFPGGHQNAIQIAGPASGDTVAFIYNNIVTGTETGGMGQYWWAQGSGNAGTTWYFFNNLMFKTASGNNIDICQEGAACGTHYVFNNTLECGSASGGVGVCANTAGMTPTATVYFINNHCIATGCENGASGSITLTETTDLIQSVSKADANTSPKYDQYAETQTYAFSPVASTNSTVGAGTNEQSLCSAIAAVYGPAGTACQNDTGYACNYNTTNHTVTCPARATVSRPTNGAWDIGAYESQSGPPPQPPTDVQAIPH